MKKFVIMTAAFGMMAAAAQAQACDTLSGTLSTMTLTPNKSYVLQGVVVVPNTVVLTIQPGVTICAMADAGLVIAQGGQLQAIGKADSLITFTSIKAPSLRAPGDWRGIAWLGNAVGNEASPSVVRSSSYAYSGTDDTYNGGTMRYVSITHAGKAVIGDSKPASLFLGALGNQTIIDHVQILESDNEAVRIFGGVQPMQDIFIQNAKTTDLYISAGYRGVIEEVLAIKNPLMQTFTSTTKGIYVENDGIGSANTPLSNPTIDAFTLIGPQQCSANPSDFSTGIYFDNNGGGTFRNGVVSGFNVGIAIVDINTASRTTTDFSLQYISIVNNQNIASSFSPWPISACAANIDLWLTNTSPCLNIEIETSTLTLGYNSSICSNYCETTQEFSLENSELQNRSLSLLKVGVLQEDPVFTWVQACPTAGCCENPSPKAYRTLGLYPNPATHTVQLEAIATQDAQVRLQVMDKATGRILYQTTTTPDAARSIDLQGYPIGQYLIQVFTTEAAYQASIQKNH